MPASTLANRIDDIEAGKIAVLYVGPDMLFARGHVPGAKQIGEISSAKGKAALSKTLAEIPATTDIVLYCGCCAVRDCPNIRPASAMLKTLNRPNAYVLDLPSRFATDWAAKGYPVARDGLSHNVIH